jgi:hypothetical protein
MERLATHQKVFKYPARVSAKSARSSCGGYRSSFGTLVTFGTPVHDHSAWEDDFHTWGLANCQFRERSFHSIRHLHGLFCDWCLANERVPCRLETFQRLLFTEGFVYADGLVYGLVPK